MSSTPETIIHTINVHNIHIYPSHVPQKNVTKTDIYWGSYRIHILVFLISLIIFVPCFEVLFFINNYFLVCILNHRASTRIFHRKYYFNFCLDIYWYLTPHNHRSQYPEHQNKNNSNNKNIGQVPFDILIVYLR